MTSRPADLDDAIVLGVRPTPAAGTFASGPAELRRVRIIHERSVPMRRLNVFLVFFYTAPLSDRLPPLWRR